MTRALKPGKLRGRTQQQSEHFCSGCRIFYGAKEIVCITCTRWPIGQYIAGRMYDQVASGVGWFLLKIFADAQWSSGKEEEMSGKKKQHELKKKS